MKNLKFAVLLVTSLILTVTPLSFAATLVPELIQPMNVPHDIGGVEPYNGNAYVWSGFTTPDGRTTILEVYNPTTNTWTQKASVPDARNGMGNFVLNDNLYSIGGEANPSGNFTNTVYRYNVASDSWTAINPFPTNIWHPMTAVCNGVGYVIGGRHGYGQTYSHVYSYNESVDLWDSKAPMPYSTMQSGVVAYDSKIYVFGGNHKTNESSNEWVKKVQIYDTVQDSWSYGIDMPVILSTTQAVVYNNSAWIVRLFQKWNN